MIWTAEIHNAKRCTFDGRDCWITALLREGRFQPALSVFGLQTVYEDSTLEETRAQATQRLRELGEQAPQIVVRGEL